MDSLFSAKIIQDFTEQFQVLLPKNAHPCREVIAALLEKMNIDKRSYQIGKTKVSVPTTASGCKPISCLPWPKGPGHTLKNKRLCWESAFVGA